jgi:hypothetical protein
LSLCLVLMAFEQGGMFIVPLLLWHRALVFQSHPKDCPIQSPITTHKWMLRIDSYPDPHRSHTAYGKGSAKWSESIDVVKTQTSTYSICTFTPSWIWAAVLQWKYQVLNKQLFALGQLHKNRDTCCHNCFRKRQFTWLSATTSNVRRQWACLRSIGKSGREGWVEKLGQRFQSLGHSHLPESHSKRT